MFHNVEWPNTLCLFSFQFCLVRTIFSEAPLINNGCAAHVRARLIFYTAAALSVLLGSSQVLKTFVRQFGCGPGTPLHVPLLLAPTQVQKAPNAYGRPDSRGTVTVGIAWYPPCWYHSLECRPEWKRIHPWIVGHYMRMRSQELLTG